MTEQWVPSNKAELISAIRREWKQLMDVVDRLDEQKMTTPDEGGWSPKDNLAHLAEWMNSLMGYHMDRRPAEEVMGLSKEQTAGWVMDVINPVLFERNKNRSIEDVMEDLKQTYERLLSKLEGMSFEDLLKPRFPDEDPEKRPLLLWVLGDSSEHFAEHRQVIERML
jgi:hypothetical protein